MNVKQASKQAAQASKTGGTHFVVYVFDQGRDVFNAEQCRLYAPLIHIEAAFVGGVQVADASAERVL